MGEGGGQRRKEFQVLTDLKKEDGGGGQDTGDEKPRMTKKGPKSRK